MISPFHFKKNPFIFQYLATQSLQQGVLHVYDSGETCRNWRAEYVNPRKVVLIGKEIPQKKFPTVNLCKGFSKLSNLWHC
jgi:hypothetical protein